MNGAPMSARGSGTVACSACGARYEDEAWAKLVLSKRIEPPELRLLVRQWDEDLCVEVRCCRECAGLIAAKRSLTARSR
jgi:hypothetical protein